MKRFEEFDDIALKIGKIVGDHGLNLLMNNAGFVTPSAKLEDVKAEQFIDNFSVNTVAPILLTKVYIVCYFLRTSSVENTKHLSCNTMGTNTTHS